MHTFYIGASEHPQREPNPIHACTPHPRSISPLTRRIATTTGCPNHTFRVNDDDPVPKVIACAGLPA